MVTTHQGGYARILLEAAIVAVVGIALAFAANQVSPRGLVLARDYFPTGTNSVVRTFTHAVPPSGITRTNLATPSAAQQHAAQMKQEGLQSVDSARAVQLFHASHLKPAIVFIDARKGEDYQAGHIPGAYEFDPYHPEKYFPAVLPVCRAAEQIVVYCNGGNCDDSETAALLLKEMGIPGQKLFIYEGGITEWTGHHQPVETGARNSGRLKIAIQ